MRPVLIIGDSLACPRPWEGVELMTTYSAQLQARIGAAYYVVNWASAENNSRRAASEGFRRTFVCGSSAHFAVVQLGIVDCAPRLMSAAERLMGGIAARIPLMRGIYRRYVRAKARHRYRFTRWFPKTLIPLEEFRVNMKAITEELLALPNMEKIFLVTIAAPGDYLVTRSFGIDENIRAYNAVLHALEQADRARIHIVDLYAQTLINPDWITADDGHHILPQAHGWIAAAIADSITLPPPG